ncbi:MAG: Bpu10I family restriction endonuclease [Anaerolineae bacterium CG03_land_8_20_14_0_80_58_20]|nr:MAG: Bpu10I family restriction endonuclease [Anaerolineae bacterium CG03_land_8_20_14_0_80_58_20]
MNLVHGSNLEQKESHKTKYRDRESRAYLAEIRLEYNKWRDANMRLSGPSSKIQKDDAAVVRERARLLENYKNFLDQQKYAEKFDSRSNLHSTVLEEFLFYLFKDLVADFGEKALVGKSHTFKDIFFLPPNYSAMLARPHASVERKDHDFVIGATVEARLFITDDRQSRADAENPGSVGIFEAPASYETRIEGRVERHYFDLPAVVIECKTYLDKTMLEGSSRAAEELKARNPNGLYLVVMEWLKLTEDVNLRKYKVDQIYVFRKQKNTDREFRFDVDYVKNPINLDVVFHLFNLVRDHLTADWEGGIKYGLERGWLI